MRLPGRQSKEIICQKGRSGWGGRTERKNKRYQDWLRRNFKLILVEALKKLYYSPVCVCGSSGFTDLVLYRRELTAITPQLLTV